MLCLQPLQWFILVRALGLALHRWRRISSVVIRVLAQGKEPAQRRFKAVLHTLLGAYYAVLLRPSGVHHIHVHHGYFGSWIGMVAARLLGISFSLTLHGSDLLLHRAYLDTKLANCAFCFTVSEHNRRFILEHFPDVDPQKILVSRLGVDPPPAQPRRPCAPGYTFTILAVGRLHAVKDHTFLLRACAMLRDRQLDFDCLIAGDGPERHHLESLIRKSSLESRVTLLGHVPRRQMNSLYRRADLVVLTSRSEGLPLVFMEAMARGGIVLGPALTGIPEIVVPGKTGFLYPPGSLDEFVERICFIRALKRAEEDRSIVSRLDWIRHAARFQIFHNFNRSNNLTRFTQRFLYQVVSQNRSPSHEDFVLQ